MNATTAGQRGFTLIELIMVIVILGILAVVAVPKYVDMQTEAAEAAAEGVYGAASAAAAINFAASLVGKAAADRPAYDATDCPSGTIATVASPAQDSGDCLLIAMDNPEGWTASTNTIAATIGGTAYTITVDSDESATDKAIISKDW